MYPSERTLIYFYIYKVRVSERGSGVVRGAGMAGSPRPTHPPPPWGTIGTIGTRRGHELTVLSESTAEHGLRTPRAPSELTANGEMEVQADHHKQCRRRHRHDDRETKRQRRPPLDAEVSERDCTDHEHDQWHEEEHSSEVPTKSYDPEIYGAPADEAPDRTAQAR